MKKLFLSILAVVCVMADGVCQTDTVRAPGVGGDWGSPLPFDLGSTVFPTMRYQQVYGASDFTRRMAEGGYIHGLRFDIADSVDGGRPFLATLPAIQINLSTTSRAVDGLSAVFSENVGADNTVVLGLSALTLSDSQRGGADIIITFTTPFFYDPRAGNLLMDVFNFGGGVSSPFNGNSSSSDTTSSVFSTGSVQDATGYVNTGGLVTVFTVTPIPEPGSLALIGLAVALTAGFHFHRHNR